MATPGRDRIERRFAAILAVGMGRREFVSLMGGAVVVWPLAARAQAPAMPVVGFLSGESAGDLRAQRGRLSSRSDRNRLYRWSEHCSRIPLAEGQYDRLLGLAGRAG